MGKLNIQKADAYTGFVADDEVLFLVKFGQKSHLEQIVNGKMRFAPSQKYVEQEKQLHDKGQGDLLEGKMKILASATQFRDPATGVLHFQTDRPISFLIKIQDVNSMPIVCFLIGTVNECCKYSNVDNYTIKFSDKTIQTIKQDFHNPDSALIIFKPQSFIRSMMDNLTVAASSIRYYDYSVMPLQQYLFLCSGDETGEVGAMTYDNRYRHLLCKDISFKEQREYRFIKLDELINDAKTYDFDFSYENSIVSCEKLFAGLEIAL